MTGIDPVRDFEYRGYTFEGTGALRRNDATISQRVSEDLGIKIGDYITIAMARGSTLSLHVVGIVKTKVETGYDVYMDLGFAQQKLGYVGRVTYAIVHVIDVARAPEVRKILEHNLGESYNVRAIKEQTIATWEGNLAGWRQGLTMISDGRPRLEEWDASHDHPQRLGEEGALDRGHGYSRPSECQPSRQNPRNQRRNDHQRN